MDELFPGSSGDNGEDGDARDYVGEAVAAFQDYADWLVEQVAPHLPNDFASAARENSLFLLLVLIALALTLVIGALPP